MSGAADVGVFVLAGGKSTRMGSDKAFVTLHGRTLLERALELARSVGSDVRIVGEAGKFAAYGPVVEDVFRECGPLGGIHAALRASHAELNLMLAVDVPFVSPEFLEYLIAQARDFPEVTAIVPRAEGRWQPLCAVYRCQFADVAEAALRSGRYKIDAPFDSIPMLAIEEDAIRLAGFPVAMFRNLNTREELTAANQ